MTSLFQDMLHSTKSIKFCIHIIFSLLTKCLHGLVLVHGS